MSIGVLGLKYDDKGKNVHINHAIVDPAEIKYIKENYPHRIYMSSFPENVRVH